MLPAVTVVPDCGESLAETYRVLVGSCPALRVTVVDDAGCGPEVAGPGPLWVRTDQLAGSVEELIGFEAARTRAAQGVARSADGAEPPVHIAASRLLHHCLWSVCLLFSGPWYLEGRIPELRAGDVWIDPPSGDFAVRPGRWATWPTPATAGESELREAVAAHVEPVLAAFQPHVRRGPRALWGMVADDLVSGIWYLGRMLGDEMRGVEAAGAVLPGGCAPLVGAADFRQLTDAEGRSHWTRTRVGCCLYYAISPGESCLTCPRTSDAERIRRLEM